MAVKIKLTLNKDKRLCGREINKVYAEGRVYHYRHFVIFYLKADTRKCGFVASKKVGNAVKRNRAKRLLRELFRNNQYKLKTGHYVLIAKKSILSCKLTDLEQEFSYFINLH